jgi:hypothetical protein
MHLLDGDIKVSPPRTARRCGRASLAMICGCADFTAILFPTKAGTRDHARSHFVIRASCTFASRGLGD